MNNLTTGGVTTTGWQFSLPSDVAPNRLWHSGCRAGRIRACERVKFSQRFIVSTPQESSRRLHLESNIQSIAIYIQRRGGARGILSEFGAFNGASYRRLMRGAQAHHRFHFRAATKGDDPDKNHTYLTGYEIGLSSPWAKADQNDHEYGFGHKPPVS